MSNQAKRCRLPVLLYHHIGVGKPSGYPDLTIPQETFRNQIEWLVRSGFVPIRLADWLSPPKAPLPKKPVLLTFDDAYADTAENALPVLESYGFGALIFVVTGQVGGTNAWDKKTGWSSEFPLMSAQEICNWADRGMEFGSHSRTHPDLRSVRPDALEEEIRGSRTVLEQILGKKVIAFSYPYGSYNEMIRQQVSAVFEAAFTTRRGINNTDTNPHDLRRTIVSASDSAFDLNIRMRIGWTPADRMRNLLHRFQKRPASR